MIARIALLTCLLAVAAAAMGPAAPAPRITVMTWNIYYGGGADGGVPDMSDLFESVQATGFHQRATRIARIAVAGLIAAPEARRRAA